VDWKRGALRKKVLVLWYKVGGGPLKNYKRFIMISVQFSKTKKKHHVLFIDLLCNFVFVFLGSDFKCHIVGSRTITALSTLAAQCWWH
jgi:hypothetical protein